MSDKGIPGMGEIYALGHKAVIDLFQGPVEVTEKVDGSFFSFMLTHEGELRMRSKGQALYTDAPSAKMFNLAMQQVEERKFRLQPGFVYRGEYLMKPKHNTLAYSKAPDGNVTLFDIERAAHSGNHLDAESRDREAARLGFDSVPVLYLGNVPNDESGKTLLNFLLEKESYLGGPKIEGIVIKNYEQFSHILMAKLVSQAFKEKHSTEWKKSNPGNKDVVENIIDMYRVEARWRKAVQHLAEKGELDGSPRDIGPLLKEVAQDVLKEEEEQIKALLWKYAWPKISRGITRGLPDWYKEQLLNEQFGTTEDQDAADPEGL